MKPIPFNNRYFALGNNFFVSTDPVPVARPGLIQFNHALSNELGIADTCLDAADSAAIFAGNRVPAGAAPIAMAYTGHQFGHFNPQLGDGRAILLGQVTGTDGVLHDIHMKGTGPTAFSRNGDGRAALGPVLREYLVSEAMAQLGVPTTRALAAVTTGEDVAREQLIPGGVITRVARSFVRVGTFEYFMARNDVESIKKLADYVIEHNYPEAQEAENPYLDLLEAVIERQARLIALWMQFGFIHGVMNTDNMSIAGETIDYGPCAFMDYFEHDKVYSSIDRNGRYAYNNQPTIGLWNLTRFAETLLPCLAEDTDSAVEIAKSKLEAFSTLFDTFWLAGMRQKIGLVEDGAEDKILIDELLTLMETGTADFTLTFHYLSRCHRQPCSADQAVRTLFDEADQIDGWMQKWRERLFLENDDDTTRQVFMQEINPVYIPRNHQIEAVIRAAEDQNDFLPFHTLHEVLQKPFEQQTGRDVYMLPPRPDQVVHRTYCGT